MGTDDTVQIVCFRCESKFKDRARRLVSGYSTQCPSCECIIFFEDGSAIEEVKAAFRTAEKIRKSLKEEMAKKINARTAALVEPVDDGADEDFDNSQPATSKQWFSTGRVRY